MGEGERDQEKGEGMVSSGRRGDKRVEGGRVTKEIGL